MKEFQMVLDCQTGVSLNDIMIDKSAQTFWVGEIHAADEWIKKLIEDRKTAWSICEKEEAQNNMDALLNRISTLKTDNDKMTFMSDYYEVKFMEVKKYDYRKNK